MQYKILIADDDTDLVKMLRSYFELKGYAVSEADDGAAALSEEEVDEMMRHTEGMDMEECIEYFEAKGIYGAEYSFEDAKYHQGSAGAFESYDYLHNLFQYGKPRG